VSPDPKRTFFEEMKNKWAREVCGLGYTEKNTIGPGSDFFDEIGFPGFSGNSGP
jgi:hypothetical protein